MEGNTSTENTRISTGDTQVNEEGRGSSERLEEQKSEVKLSNDQQMDSTSEFKHISIRNEKELGTEDSDMTLANMQDQANVSLHENEKDTIIEPKEDKRVENPDSQARADTVQGLHLNKQVDTENIDQNQANALLEESKSRIDLTKLEQPSQLDKKSILGEKNQQQEISGGAGSIQERSVGIKKKAVKLSRNCSSSSLSSTSSSGETENDQKEEEKERINDEGASKVEGKHDQLGDQQDAAQIKPADDITKSPIVQGEENASKHMFEGQQVQSKVSAESDSHDSKLIDKVASEIKSTVQNIDLVSIQQSDLSAEKIQQKDDLLTQKVQLQAQSSDPIVNPQDSVTPAINQSNQHSLASSDQQLIQKSQTETAQNQSLKADSQPNYSDKPSSSTPTQEAEEDAYGEEDLDEDGGQNERNFVIEISPKGRFKRFGEELGRGAYKIVYKGVDNETGREIAWNVINLNRLPKQERIRIKSEIDLIKKLQHKNIIHFISAWYNKEKEQVIFITEMITGGSLRKYLKRIKTPRLKVIKGWCKEILQGLVYLHDQQPHPIIHRDLKCDNIFINSNSGDIRIGDLGLSTPMANSFTTSVLGTPEFMAPELYQECYGTGVDIYAFGMCVLEMLTLERPYKECQNPAQIYFKVVNGIRPQALDRIQDDDVKNFIILCLDRADSRPSAKALLESAFLNETESEKNNQEVKVKRAQSTEKKKPSFAKGQDMMGAISVKDQILKGKKGSTIIEEDEENSGDSKNFQKQKADVEESKSKGKVQVENDTNKEEKYGSQTINITKIVEPPSHSQDIIMVNGSQAVSDSQQETQQTVILASDVPSLIVEKIEQVDENQNAVANSQQIQSEISNHILTQAVEVLTKSDAISSVQNAEGFGEKAKKKQKKEAKTKLLDQSVSFLQHIDEQKQKMLQERTMLQSKQDDDEEPDEDDNDDSREPEDLQQDGSPKLLPGNILDELKKEDMIEEQKIQAEKNMLIAMANQTAGQSFQLQKGGEKLAKVAVNYDSSDPQLQSYHKKDGQALQKDKETPLDGGQARKFGLEKKFKEDHVSSTSQLKKTVSIPAQAKSTQNVGKTPLISQTKPKNPLGNTGSNADLSKNIQSGSNDEIKRTQSQLPASAFPSIQHMNVENNKTLHSVSLGLQPSKFSIGNSQKQQIQGQNQPQANQQDVFDDQNSSSSESSQGDQDQDSEVDKIQLSKGQQQQSQKQSQEKQATPKSAQKSSLQSNFANGQNTPQPQPAKGAQPQIQQSQTSQKPQQQTPNSQASLIKPLDQTKQTQKQELKPPIQAPQLNKNHNSVPQPPKKEEIKTSAIGVSNSAQSSSKLIAPINTSVGVASNKDSYFKLLYKMDGKEVWFDFDTKQDTPEGVAREMVKELSLNESQYDVISKQIQSAINKKDVNRSTEQPKTIQQAAQPAPTQTANPKSQAPQAPTLIPLNTAQPLVTVTLTDPSTIVGQSQSKKPATNSIKLSKELATSMFTKLLQDIEFFYSHMQYLGITNTEEIVEAMDFSPEEKIIRMNMINKVLLAKREYKSQLEVHKTKQSKKVNQANPGPNQANDKSQSTQNPPPEDSEDVLNMTFSIPATGKTETKTIPPAIAPHISTNTQAKQQKLQQSPPTPSQIASSFEKNVEKDQQLSQQPTIQQSSQHHQAKKQNSFEQSNIQAQVILPIIADKKMKDVLRITYHVPQHIRDNFKASPQSFSCFIKLSKSLKKLTYEDLLEQPDEEVIMLQNLLNLMWHDSVLVYSQKAPTPQEALDVIQKHVPLKIDGKFGDKTEKCVVQFQKYKEITQTGSVNEYVWKLMLDHANQIVGEPPNKKPENRFIQGQVQTNPFKDAKGGIQVLNQQTPTQAKQVNQSQLKEIKFSSTLSAPNSRPQISVGQTQLSPSLSQPLSQQASPPSKQTKGAGQNFAPQNLIHPVQSYQVPANTLEPVDYNILYEKLAAQPDPVQHRHGGVWPTVIQHTQSDPYSHEDNLNDYGDEAHEGHEDGSDHYENGGNAQYEDQEDQQD